MKNKFAVKFTICIITAIIFITGGTTSMKLQSASPDAALKFNIRIDGILHSMSVEPLYKDDYIMVSMRDFLTLLGAEYKWNNSTNSFTAKRNGRTLEMKTGSKNAIINGESVVLPVAPFMHKDSLMVPLTNICEAFGIKSEYENDVISLDTGKKQGVLSIIVPEDAIVLTYAEALRQATSSNSSIENLKDSLEYIEDARKDIIDKYDKAARAGLEELVVPLLRSLDAMDTASSNAPYNEQIIKTGTEASLREILSNIASYEMDIQLLDESIKLQRKNVKNLELLLSLGMTSKTELLTAKQNLLQNESNLSMLVISLDSERKALKNILKASNKNDYAVDFEPKTGIINISGIDGYISGRVSDSPVTKIKEKAMTDTKYAMDTWSEAAGENKIDLENKYKAAARDYDDYKRNLEAAIRSAQNNIKLLMEKQKSLEIDLEKAISNYNDITASYEAGMVTMYEVDLVKLAILNAEVSLSKNAYSLWTLSYAFEYPYLLIINN